MSTPESLPRGGYPNALDSVEPQAPSQLTHTQTTSTGGVAHSTLATGRPQKIVAELIVSYTCPLKLGNKMGALLSGTTPVEASQGVGVRNFHRHLL